MTPKVSVIVPVYNAEKYLIRCIESILSQTEQDFELLLINDGSTDQSGLICNEYLKKSNKIVVYHQMNGGVSKARNCGLLYAKGKYVTFIDADDWIEPGYLATLLEIMSPNGLAVSGVTIGDENLLKKTKIKILDKELAMISVVTHKGIQGYPVAKMFDLKTIKCNDIKFNPEITICEDMLFNIQYLSYVAGEITQTNISNYHYIKNVDSALNRRFVKKGNFDKKDMSEIYAMDLAINCINNMPNVVRVLQLRKAKACITVLRVMIANDCRDKVRYNELIKYARKNCLSYVLSDIGATSSKISMVVGCISPRLEYFIWRQSI